MKKKPKWGKQRRGPYPKTDRHAIDKSENKQTKKCTQLNIYMTTHT